MESIIFTLCVLGLICIAMHIINTSRREEYYEVVNAKLGELAGQVFINEREALYDLLHCTNAYRNQKNSIVSYRRAITSILASCQKRNEIGDDTASKVLDIIYEK